MALKADVKRKDHGLMLLFCHLHYRTYIPPITIMNAIICMTTDIIINITSHIVLLHLPLVFGFLMLILFTAGFRCSTAIALPITAFYGNYCL